MPEDYPLLRRKIIPASLAAGIAVLSLSLIIGAFTAANHKEDQSTAKKQPAIANRSVSADKPQTAGIGTPFEGATHVESAPAVVIRPANPDWAADVFLSVQIPTTEGLLPSRLASKRPLESNPVDLAVAVLEQNKYQRAIELLAPHQYSASHEDLEAVGLYAKALVGRAPVN